MSWDLRCSWSRNLSIPLGAFGLVGVAATEGPLPIEPGVSPFVFVVSFRRGTPLTGTPSLQQSWPQVSLSRQQWLHGLREPRSSKSVYQIYNSRKVLNMLHGVNRGVNILDIIQPFDLQSIRFMICVAYSKISTLGTFILIMEMGSHIC